MTSTSSIVANTSHTAYLVKKAGFLSLPEELRSYVLSFLNCRDLLRCTSVCKALRWTYMSSSELQYIVELSGQQLLRVPNTDGRIAISERLRLLRDRSHAWFKFDLHSFKTISFPTEMCDERKAVIDGHLSLWDRNTDLAWIIPIVPKRSQQTFTREWSPGTLCPVRYSDGVFMDPTQNLIAVVYSVHDETAYIDLRALDGDCVHPRAAGPRLIVLGPPGHNETRFATTRTELKGFGRHIALRRSLLVSRVETWASEMWQLQIWDWRHSTTSNSVLSDTTRFGDFCFLGSNRLLVVTIDLKIYSIEDMSQKPQLLACFQSPERWLVKQCLLPMDDNERLQTQMHDKKSMHTSDPKHRLLCITTDANRVYIISTRIFFDLDGMTSSTPIPWNEWGPSNARIFQHPCECKVHVSGNRVLQAFPVGTHMRFPECPKEYILHMMDFSPLAVTNRRGLGRVVKEPSTIDVTEYYGLYRRSLTTSLPYVEVVSDRKMEAIDLEDIWLDKDNIYMLNNVDSINDENIRRLEVIDV
ncbi:hypothetical protein BD769DRAFT_1385473 [Suillus cothurnatus]|nr:hypothetical protein BD769DRAFT_1385473 [Suillus cothurnatus]